MIRSGHRRLARPFNLCYRYIDDLIVFNNKKFLDYLKEIYPSQLTVEKANKSDHLADYLDFASDCLLPTKMVFRICETCLIPSDSVELRSSDQILCDSCEEKRRRTAKIKAKNASILNAKAQPFLSKRLHRRSRSAGAILPEQVWASPPLASNYNNSEGGKKNQPEAESANKQTRTKQHVIKHGTHQEDEGADPAIASILDNSLAKWSTTTKSPTLKRLQELCRETLKRLQELCREKNIKTTGRKKELKARLEEHQTKGRANVSQARPGPSGNTGAEEHATPPKLAEASVRGKKSPLIVKLPRSTSLTVPKSVTYMIEDEDTDDYEADISDDEVEGDRPTTKS